jgi:hypothetical protein
VVDDDGLIRPPRRTTASLAVRPRGESPERQHVPDEGEVTAVEAAIAEALDGFAERMVERAIARLQSPKLRRGTRHFEAAFTVDTRVGSKALDTTRIVDPERWSDEAQDAVRPLVEAAATIAVPAALEALTEGGDGPQEASEARQAAAVAIRAGVVGGVLAMVGRSAAQQAQILSDKLNAADQAGAALSALVGISREVRRRLRAWKDRLANWAAWATFEGADDGVLVHLIQMGIIDAGKIRRTWITRLDDNVRETHRRAHGQTVAVGSPFVVGRSLLRYPHDPLGPPSETANCRCTVLVTVGARRVALVGTS